MQMIHERAEEERERERGGEERASFRSLSDRNASIYT